MIESLQHPMAQSGAKGPRSTEAPSALEEPSRNGPSTSAAVCVDAPLDTKRPPFRAYRGPSEGAEPGGLSEWAND